MHSLTPVIAEPGTIEDLLADAAADGHPVSVRLIREWTKLGLLSKPRRRPAGRGRGSDPALYSANQRKLFNVLLRKRTEGSKISQIAKIPVWFWMYWGDDYVPLAQARGAFMTWLSSQGSLAQARSIAREVVKQFDNPKATRQARQRLVDLLTEINYTGRLGDTSELEDAWRQVFQPDAPHIDRVAGDLRAPVTIEAMIQVAQIRTLAVDALNAGKITDTAFRRARLAHLVHYADYEKNRAAFVAGVPASMATMFEEVSDEAKVNNCCRHLLTAIGMERQFPEQAGKMRDGFNRAAPAFARTN